jgi:beta-lactamase class A
LTRLGWIGIALGIAAVLLYVGATAGLWKDLGGESQEFAEVAGIQGVRAQDQVPAEAAMTPSPPTTSPTARSPRPRPRAVPTRASLAPPPARPTPASTPMPLPEDLERYVADLDGIYGVAVRNLEDGETVLIDSEHVFPAASLYKLLVMYRVYQGIEEGWLSEDDVVVFQYGDLAEAEEGDDLAPGDAITVGDAVEWMITFSSNPAAYALARHIGGWNEVTAAAAELGMEDTTWGDEYFLTTPADMLRFFDLLGNRLLVSPEASDAMIAVLLRQQISDRLPAYLPSDAEVAHKTGDLPEVRHDVGIVFAGDSSWVIAVMSEWVDPEAASEAIAEISRRVFDRFGG